MTDKILGPIKGKDHKIGNVGMIVEEEIIDVKIIVEMMVEIEEDEILEVIITEAEVQHQEVTEDIIAQMPV